MLVDVSDIISSKNKEMIKEVSVELTSFCSRLGTFPILEKPSFTLRFANVENKWLEIKGEADITITIPCDRCLTEVANRFSLQIAKKIDLQQFVDGTIAELDDFDYMIEKNLDVDKLIFGEILVSWPMKVLCKEDCHGICKRCGENLNSGTCQCQKTEPDPRMAAIQDIFNQYKEV